jgi:hypothetical protein
MEKIKSVDGVASIRMRLIKEIILVQDWYREEIQRHIAAP